MMPKKKLQKVLEKAISKELIQNQTNKLKLKHNHGADMKIGEYNSCHSQTSSISSSSHFSGFLQSSHDGEHEHEEEKKSSHSADIQKDKEHS